MTTFPSVLLLHSLGDFVSDGIGRGRVCLLVLFGIVRGPLLTLIRCGRDRKGV